MGTERTKEARLLVCQQGAEYHIDPEEIIWSSCRTGKPCTLEARYPKQAGELFQPGAKAQLDIDGQNVFCGVIFECGATEEQYSFLAYDALRYLTFSDSYAIDSRSAGEILQMIAADAGIPTGSIDQTGASISLVADGRKLIDILCDALSQTEEETGKKFILYDQGGRLNLREESRLDSGIVLGENSLASGYEYTCSIDDKTYNKVVLLRQDLRRGFRETTALGNSSSQEEWGTLQYYERVNSNLSRQQTQALAQQILKNHGSSKKQLRIDALGDPNCRAGWAVQIDLKEYQGRGRIETAEHQLKGKDYRMRLEIQTTEE